MLRLLAACCGLVMLCFFSWFKGYAQPIFHNYTCSHTSHPDTLVPIITTKNTGLVTHQHTHQHHHHHGFECGADALQRSLYQKYPKLKQKAALQELRWQQHITQGLKTGGVHTIPVVVHLIHNNGPANMSNARVQAAIQQLNDAFGNRGYYNPATGVDTEIQFCLAQRDSLGGLTTGVTRTVSPLTVMDKNTDDLAVKNLSRWNPNDYVNIWVVDEIIGGVAGYAYFPSAHGTAIDGIVVEDLYMGLTPQETSVLVHEMGHYLGLYHTFEGGCTNNNCLVNGDKVCDTPPDNTTARPLCSAVVNSCTSDEDDTSTNNPFRSVALGGQGDQPDQKENYMDYSDLTCYDRFSQGQADRMDFFLHNDRASLLQSSGCMSPCNTAPIVALFTPSNTTTTAGSSINFTNNSSNATTYTWYVNGVLFSNSANTSYNFPTVGTFWVRLDANNADPNCGVESDSVQITVFCAPPCGEICDNGIDDDGNGQIDCFDSACNCAPCSNKQSNIWHFAREAGLDFSSGSPVSIIGGRTMAIEGCATQCDVNGNLLFYTDGRRVWNRNHQVMPNGTGLLGSSSTAQIVVVPKPNDPYIYYVFVPTMQVDTVGLSYSEVDFSLNNNLGAVTTKNVILTNFKTTEGITAIKHCNNQDFWVIVKEFETNRYATFEVNSTGVNPTFLSQNIGRPHLDLPSPYMFPNAITAFRGNSKGNQLAVLHRLEGGCELLDFDKSTGLLSNPVYWQLATNHSPYGVEFSPSGQYLYISAFGSGFTPDVIYQYDVSTPNTVAISASSYAVSNEDLGCLQLGPDGKIYHSRFTGSLLDVINEPNLAGAACNYQSGAVNIAPGLSSLGLPNFIKEYVAEPITGSISGLQYICNVNGASVEPYFITDYTCNIDTVTWYHNGVNTINSVTDSLLLLNAAVSGTDTLMATIVSACSTKVDTMIVRTIIAPVVDLGPDTAVCQNGVVSFNIGTGYQSCRWQDNSQDSIFTATESGQYWVTCTTYCGTTYTDTVNVTVDLLPVVSYPDVTVNVGDTVFLPTGGNTAGYQHQWFPNQDISCDTCPLPDLYPTVTTTYYHVMTNSLGCVSLDSFTITIINNCTPMAVLDSSSNSCGGVGGYLQVRGSNGLAPYRYLWSTTDTITTLQNLPTGDYYLTLTDASNCVVVDTFTIVAGTIPSVSTAAVVDPTCGNNTGSIDLTTTNAQHYRWSTGDTTASLQNLPAGNYDLILTSPEGCTALYSYNLTNSNAPTIQLDSLKNTCGADGFIQVQGVNGLPLYRYLWSTGDTTNTLQNLAAGVYQLTLTDGNNCPTIDSFIIDTLPIPQITNAQLQQPSCGQNNGQIALTTTATQSYAWSINATTPTISNLSSGRYTVVLTSADGCTNSAFYALIDTTDLVNIQVDSITAASCALANGSISLQPKADYQYQWSTGDTTATISNLAAGNYQVIVSNNDCTDSLVMTVPNLPIPNLAAYINSIGLDSAIGVTNQAFMLGAGADERPQGVQYTWFVDVIRGGTINLDSSNAPTTTGMSADTGFYQLRIVATDGAGCSVSDTVWLELKEVTFLGMPTAFTPNGDGMNDYYRPANLEAKYIKAFRIYNRWGQLVYEGANTQAQWDGTYQGQAQPTAVYVYYLEYELPGMGSYQIRGEFTLIR
ncbi:MAG: M43 family zinc metalloprotease [Aureispira sp.]